MLAAAKKSLVERHDCPLRFKSCCDLPPCLHCLGTNPGQCHTERYLLTDLCHAESSQQQAQVSALATDGFPRGLHGFVLFFQINGEGMRPFRLGSCACCSLKLPLHTLAEALLQRGRSAQLVPSRGLMLWTQFLLQLVLWTPLFVTTGKAAQHTQTLANQLNRCEDPKREGCFPSLFTLLCSTTFKMLS